MTNSRFTRVALLVALLAALHGLVYVPLVSENTETDSRSYTATAKAILDGSYSTPIWAGSYFTYPYGFYDLTAKPIGRGSPTFYALERQAFRPPGYPLALAAVGGGEDGVSQTAALVLQAVLFGLGTFLLVLTVRRWWGERIALLAGVLYAVDPWSKRYVALILSETLAGFLLLALAYAFTRAWQARAPAWWAAAGMLAAALTLTRAAFAVAVPLVVLGALVRSGPRLRAAGATAGAAALLVLPWLAWTDSVTGKPVLADWGEGFNLYLAAAGEGRGRSAADIEADPTFVALQKRNHRFAPTTRELLHDRDAHPRYLRRADEALRAAARELYADRLRDDPAQVAWEFLYRAWLLWDAHQDWYQPSGTPLVALALLDWLTIVLALAGGAIALARNGAARCAVVFLLCYTVTIATHHVEPRFAMPARGLFLALVALALAKAWLRAGALRARRRAQPALRA